MTWSTIYPILYWQSWLENWVFPLYTKFFESGLKFGIRWCLICWSFLMFARKPRKKTKIQPEKKRWWCLCFAENVTWGSIICLHKGIWFNNLCPVLTVRKGWFHFRFSSPKKTLKISGWNNVRIPCGFWHLGEAEADGMDEMWSSLTYLLDRRLGCQIPEIFSDSSEQMDRMNPLELDLEHWGLCKASWVSTTLNSWWMVRFTVD